MGKKGCDLVPKLRDDLNSYRRKVGTVGTDAGKPVNGVRV